MPRPYIYRAHLDDRIQTSAFFVASLCLNAYQANLTLVNDVLLYEYARRYDVPSERRIAQFACLIPHKNPTCTPRTQSLIFRLVIAIIIATSRVNLGSFGR